MAVPPSRYRLLRESCPPLLSNRLRADRVGEFTRLIGTAPDGAREVGRRGHLRVLPTPES